MSLTSHAIWLKNNHPNFSSMLFKDVYWFLFELHSNLSTLLNCTLMPFMLDGIRSASLVVIGQKIPRPYRRRDEMPSAIFFNKDLGTDCSSFLRVSIQIVVTSPILIQHAPNKEQDLKMCWVWHFFKAAQSQIEIRYDVLAVLAFFHTFWFWTSIAFMLLTQVLKGKKKQPKQSALYNTQALFSFPSLPFHHSSAVIIHRGKKKWSLKVR